MQIIFYIIIPNVKNGILSGLILSAGRSLAEVGMTLLPGGNIAGKTETISLAIFNAVFEGNFEKAALLSCLLGGISILLFVFSTIFKNRKTALIDETRTALSKLFSQIRRRGGKRY